jgi:membrane protein implicated in regulation of membrane protease activity
MVLESPTPWIWRIVTLLVTIALIVIAVVIVLPVTVIAGVILALVAAFVGAKTWLSRSRENGALDGRRNVAVRRRD